MPRIADTELVEKVKILNTYEKFDGSDILVTLLVKSEFSDLPFNSTFSDVGLYMNSVKVGKVVEVKPSKLMKGEKEIRAVIRIVPEKITEWWVSHIENNETTTAILRSDVVYNLDGMLLKLMHQKDSSFKTNLLGNLNFAGREIASDPYTMIASMRSEWGNVTFNTTQIIHEVMLHTPKKMLIHGVTCKFYINDLEFNDSCQIFDTNGNNVTLPLTIESESDGKFLIIENIDNSKFGEWWESHIANGEKSIFTFKILIEANIDGERLNFTLADAKYELKTNFLGR